VSDPSTMADTLDGMLFGDDLNYSVYQALTSTPTLRDAMEAADPAASDLLQRLAVEDTEADPADVMARLVEEAARRELVIIQSEVVSADESMMFERSAEMAWVKLRMEELREPSTAAQAVDQLLPWLVERPQENR